MHWQIKGISRAAGRSSVAAIAYRTGERLRDERTQLVYDYTRRVGILETALFVPGQEQPVDREVFWNQVEQAEKRKDAQVAREIIVALPHELSTEAQLELARTYAQELSGRTGWGVDMAVHAPGQAGDQRNTHVHLLCTTRVIERDPAGCPVMGRKTREWNDPRLSKETVALERAGWAGLVNRMLEREGIAQRVDPRSYAEQGVDQEPTQHLGVHAMAMERRGIQTERGDYNRTVQAHNQELVNLSERRAEKDAALTLKVEMMRWEQMDVKALEAEARQCSPQSARTLAFKDPAVQEAYKPLHRYVSWNESGYEAYQRGELGWLNEDQRLKVEKEAESARIACSHAKKAEERWRDEHPVKATLFELGIPNRELKDLMEDRAEKQAHSEQKKQALGRFEVERSKAELQLERAIHQAMPEAKKEHERLQERYQVLKKILEPKQELARQQKREQERERGGGRGMER